MSQPKVSDGLSLVIRFTIKNYIANVCVQYCLIVSSSTEVDYFIWLLLLTKSLLSSYFMGLS
ncbi:uncharacterized protein BDW43DRAFT_267336 [Aspergillus alliaceus]|uniref:uncharacterized protein n=1 Tax=Petromyces alliaceus TaxID=209559 RepID=UPI0012A622AB|nr:uncharacterized protein BDW43DRAFT_267336 [Aspergillus alliaceus]KAB8236651.1 hypothetical protein BDW43DRAFT_267336 [Aspergillus alliaceus]